MAYAAVISLKCTIFRLTNSINIPQILKPAFEECDSLLSLLKILDRRRSRRIDRSGINELDAKIRDAVWKLEDVLDSYMLLNLSIISPSQSQVHGDIQVEVNWFLKTVRMLRQEYYRLYSALLQNALSGEEDFSDMLEQYGVIQNPLSGEEDDRRTISFVGRAQDYHPPLIVQHFNSTTIGLSDLSENIINDLLARDSGIRVVSLVGMAGIGKSHLATQIYHHPLILQHFHSRVWVSLGPTDQINNIFVDIAGQIELKPRDLFKDKSMYKLREILEKSFRPGRIYFIVLDDIWNAQFVNDFCGFLRLDILGNIRFRLILTTRLHEVANVQYGGLGKFYHIPFLNNEESWNLLWQNVFITEKSFPSQLEKPGRKIAEKCEGLPLLILTIANILRGLDKTQDYWEKVADNKTTTFTEAYDQIYEVLLPSYEYLPQHLKACFLYMGVFPQTCEIRSSKLINLWAVEDFPLRPNWRQNLEESAMESLKDLVSNSIVIICKQSFESVRRIKSSKLHSAYWYLCVKEAGKNKLFHVLRKLTDVISIETPRRLAVQNNIVLGLKETYESMAAVISSTTCSLLCTGVDHQYPVRICFNMMQLKVLDAYAIRFYEFPEEVVKLLQLRYLTLTHNGEFPSSLSKLQQLQYLILGRHHSIIKLVQRDSNCFPEEIWEMQELRHVRIMGSNLPNPSEGAELPKLSTLYVNANSCTEHVFKGIPNLKKLGITIELQPADAAETVRCLAHIRILDQLESLKCVVVNPRLRSQSVVALADDLSDWRWWHLKKMSLEGLGLSWNYMSAVGSLYCLEVLKLRCSAFQGPEWNTKAGQFQSLKYLLLEDLDLVHWTAGEKYFPRLNHLSVQHCYKLKEIPCQIGIADNTVTKLLVEVDDCSPSVVDSVEKIKLKTTYSELQFEVNSSWNFR